MLLPIDPVIISLGPWAVRWFGVLALVGLGVAIWLSRRALDQQSVPRAVLLDALAWGLPCGVVCARATYVLGWWDYYFTHADAIWRLSIDGLSLWGGLLGGGAIVVARLRSRRGPSRARRVLDAVVPHVALGIAIGQVGAFLDGAGQGIVTSVPWATQYASRLAATPDFGIARHPVQVYDALVALALAGLLRIVPRAWPAGSRLALFLVVLGGAWLGLGKVRLDPPFLFGLQVEQLLALVGAAVGLVYGGAPLLRAGRWRARDEAAIGGSGDNKREQEIMAA